MIKGLKGIEMKKLLTITMALCLMLTAFTGCKKDDNNESSKSEVSKNESSESEISGSENEVSEAEASKSEENVTGTDMKVKIGENEYTLPVPFENFIESGWTYSGDSLEELEADDYKTIEAADESGLKIKLFVINGTTQTLPLDQCAVGGFDITAAALGDSGVKVLLNGDFDCFAATAEEVREKYGKASYDEETGGSILIEYEYKAFEVKSFEFPDEEGTLQRLEIQKFFY